jgi:hypothetical protein
MDHIKFNPGRNVLSHKTAVFIKLFTGFKIGWLFCFSQRTVQETKGWDVFEDPPPKSDSGSMANQNCLQITVKLLKVVAYLFTFVIVLGSGVIAKGTTLFMTSQLRKDRIIPYCNRDIGTYLTWVRNPLHVLLSLHCLGNLP